MAIIRPPIAGLHFFGRYAGALVLALYLRREGYDVWLFMDAVAPAALLGQAIGRLGNFVTWSCTVLHHSALGHCHSV